MKQPLLYLLDLRGQQAISLVEVVASLAKDANAITIEDITSVNSQVGPDAAVANQVETTIASRTHSVSSHSLAITAIVLTCSVP